MPADRWTLERSWPGDGARLRVADGSNGWLVMPGGEADVVLASDYDALAARLAAIQEAGHRAPERLPRALELQLDALDRADP